MKKFHRFPLFLLFLYILTSGCAHVISKDLRARTDLSLTFGQVLQNPNAYKDKNVLWGGEIIQTVNQKDGTTLIEVFQKSLGWRGEPKNLSVSEGRFLVLVERYLDPYLYREGRKITVAGKILGEKIKPLGEMDYRHPFLLSEQIYVWRDYYCQYPDPYCRHDPWWDYPLVWRFHFHYD